jgi:tripartite-type tricarboxylate transporter receptor subunit TctC
MNKKKYLYCALITAMMAAAPLSAQSAATGAGETYPTKPVRLLVPFAPGGGTDALARMIAQRLTESLGQSVVVDNRPAVDGIVGTETVAKAAPDGYTLILVSSSHAINPALRKSLPYDTLKDFTPITQTAIQQLLLVTHASVPAKNVKELVALLKADSTKYNYGSSSSATALPMELLKSMSGVQVQHIPYKGTAPMMNDLLGGQVQMGIVGAVSAIPQVKSGRLRGLAIGDSKRSIALPDIPTIAESGVPGYQASIWTGVFGPARLPRTITDKVNKEIVRIVQQPDFKTKMNQMGSETVGSTPEAWGQFIETEIAKWAKIAKIAGLQPE